MTSNRVYVVAGSKPWNRRIFDEVIATYPGQWYFIATADELTVERLATMRPRFIFFLHWSWKVPAAVVDHYECVCFHMTDVPYGRGGSPLQHLILAGHHHTTLTALRMTNEIDAGPVYLKERLELEGSAEDIYIRASSLAAAMVRRLIHEPITPIPQTGEPVIFRRRKPQDSRIRVLPDVQSLYDFIRMLDAEGYPRAFLEHGGFRYEFSRAALRDGSIEANVSIVPKGRPA